MSAADTPEPPPRTNEHPALWPLVIADIRSRHGFLPHVVADMEARDQFGRAKYGTPLQPHNGRDALADAYQEALDLAVYLRQVVHEEQARNDLQGETVRAYHDALSFVVRLRGRIHDRSEREIADLQRDAKGG